MTNLEEYISINEKKEQERLKDTIDTFKIKIEETLNYMKDTEIIVYGQNNEEIKTKMRYWNHAPQGVTNRYERLQYSDKTVSISPIIKWEKDGLFKKRYLKGFDIPELKIRTQANFMELLEQKIILEKTYNELYRLNTNTPTITNNIINEALEILLNTKKNFDEVLTGPKDYRINHRHARIYLSVAMPPRDAYGD